MALAELVSPAVGRCISAGVVFSVALLVGACGDDEKSDAEQVRDVTETYLVALGEKDYSEACDQLAASAKRDLVDYVLAQLPELGTSECESLFKQIIELTDESELAALRDVEVENVNITGETAVVIVKGATQNAQLAKVEGDWKVSALQFPGAEGAATPTPAPEPETAPPDETDAEAIRDNLTDAGYDVRDAPLGSGKPKPADALATKIGAGELTIYVYATADEAAQSKAEFASVEKDFPDQTEVRKEGTAVYVGTIEEPDTLSLPSFRTAVDVATGYELTP